MALGDKLASTIKELEEANIKSAAAQASADVNALRLNKDKRDKFLQKIFDDICRTIKAGKVPHVLVTDYTDQAWLRKAKNGKADFQSLWMDFITQLGKEKLAVEMNEEHDGVGIKSWVAITVKPLPQKAVYRSANSRN